MRSLLVAVVLVSLVAGCGSGGDSSPITTAATATTTPPARPLTIRITAEKVLGCTEALARGGFDVGTGSRLKVLDGDGYMLGVGTLALTPTADVCDWTTTIEINPADFVVLVAGGELVTITRAELDAADWSIHVAIDISGRATLA
jgi:hypothetical protein